MRRSPNFSPDFYNLAFAANEARGLFELFKSGRATKASLYREILPTRKQLEMLRADGHTVELLVKFRRRILVHLVRLFREFPHVKPQPFTPYVSRPRPLSNRKRKLTDGQVQLATELLREGRKWREVAAEFDVTPNCLMQYIGSKRDFA